MAGNKFDEGQEDQFDETADFGTGSDESGEDYGALSGKESSLGNLPPLSDFESSDGGAFDSNLPPLSGMDSDSGGKGSRGSIGGLPPISDIPVETPVPKDMRFGTPMTPASPATPAFDTPTSQHQDTPREGTGFQDLSADSDFTPETPEVAPPGPESDIETPMFDSAFGADSSAFSGTADTSAPTQAMETPMFGANPQAPAAGFGDQGFDADAFGGGFDRGTPAPDFSPDTAQGLTPATMAGMGEGRGGGRSSGVLVGVLALVFGAVVGIAAGPHIPGLGFIPNPVRDELETAKTTISQRDAEIGRLRAMEGAGVGTTVSPEELADMQEQKIQLGEEINNIREQLEAAQTQLTARNQELETVRSDLENTTNEFVEAEADFNQLVKETSITQAQKTGLDAEVVRLRGLVGRLEDANTRRTESINTLRANIAALAILVAEGNPLVPEEFSRESRLNQVRDLQNQAEAAKWVAPPILDEYTELMQEELAISQKRVYFFATIPVRDRFGTEGRVPAECLMNGNWGTYYRTLDGQHIGVYQNVSPSGPARYAFRDVTEAEGRKEIETEIFSNRVPGYEAMLDIMVQKHLMFDDRTGFQKAYDSL